jgi:hypothetical protein
MFRAAANESKQHSNSARFSLKSDPARELSPLVPAAIGPAWSDAAGLGAASPPVAPLRQVFRLHSMYGNQAVLRMLSPQASMIQAKLTVNQPGDQYEQEADRVADRVMQMSESGSPAGFSQSQAPHISRAAPGSVRSPIQRQASPANQQEVKEEEQPSILSLKEIPGTNHALSPGLEAQILAARNGGEPLAADARAFFEPRFGVDFGQVRIHRDSAAGETARRLNARAYTLGHHIAFAPGEYQTDSERGRHLMAHELTHVVQQGDQIRTLMRACDCSTRGGTPPTSAQHSFLSRFFPNLQTANYCVTAPATPTYNCFAWSIGNTTQWIDSQIDSVYGNNNGTLEFSDFDAFYQQYGGLRPVTDRTPAAPEVVLYAVGNRVTHAARKTGSGDCRYESKLGANVRIAHEPWDLEGGSTYGNVGRYYE